MMLNCFINKNFTFAVSLCAFWFSSLVEEKPHNICCYFRLQMRVCETPWEMSCTKYAFLWWNCRISWQLWIRREYWLKPRRWVWLWRSEAWVIPNQCHFPQTDELKRGRNFLVFFTNVKVCQDDNCSISAISELPLVMTCQMEKALRLSAVYLIVPPDYPVREVEINFQVGQVRATDQLHENQELHEAVFDPPVTVQPGDTTITFRGNLYYCIPLEGESISGDGFSISMQNCSYWYYVAGFKCNTEFSKWWVWIFRFCDNEVADEREMEIHFDTWFLFHHNWPRNIMSFPKVAWFNGYELHFCAASLWVE